MSRSLFARLARRYGPRVDPAQRREFLRATLAASAGLLLSSRPAGALARLATRRIVVVGAGFAGLACAFELKATGYHVTVVEARGRVGGRIITFTDFIPGRSIEGGGEFIGSNHPTWAAYRERFNLEFLDVADEEDLESPVVLGGQRLESATAARLYEEMKHALAHMTADAAGTDADEPWKSPRAEALDARTTADWLSSLEASDLCRAAIIVELAANNGKAVEAQSYLGNLAQVKGGGLEKYWTESEAFRCRGGNQQLARHLAESIGPGRILLQTPVRAIAATRGGMVVQCGGKDLECDDVVLAAPPSVWSKIEFTPALPAALTPQMGCNLKHLSSVKRRFWRDAKLSPDGLGDGDASMTWDATDGQPEGAACLAAFSGGPAAERSLARPEDERRARYASELEALLPGYRDQVTGTRFMDWPRDPWTQAGYSFPAPGQVCTIGPTLRRGLGNLHFAGEHACYAFVGYMEGALNSGASLARRLAERDGVAPRGARQGRRG
jgi:monoamine oxidase